MSTRKPSPYLAIVFSVLWFTDSDYPFGVFKPFLHVIYYWVYIIIYDYVTKHFWDNLIDLS